MSSKAAWLLGVGASSLLAYAIWRRWGNVDAASDLAVDEASEDSFPASDAPSHTPMVGSRVAR
jgi:hypothetical protein